MKPTTYYTQNAAIDSLVSAYGSQLQRMNIGQKLALLCILSRTMYIYNVHGNVNGMALEIRSQDYAQSLDPELESHLSAIDEHCTEQDALRLMEALVNQLVPCLGKQQSAWASQQ